MKKKSSSPLRVKYAPLLRKFEKLKDKDTGVKDVCMWCFPLNIMWSILLLMGISLIFKGRIGAGMSILIPALLLYVYIWQATIIDQVKDWSKKNFLDEIVSIFSKDKSWDLEYEEYLEYLPENVSYEDYQYMIEATTGIDMSDIIINDNIIGTKDNNTFYYFNYGYEFDSRYIYGGEGLMLNLLKPIDGYLYIMTDTLEKAGGFVGKGVQKTMSMAIPNGNDIITMDNLEFEKYFTVRGEDKILANSILTPTFMENLIKLAKLHDVTTYISFHKSWMFIALDTTHNKFEFSIEKENILNEIRKVDKELSNVLKIVETINLDMHEMNIHK